MIQTLTLQNFKGQTRTFEFSPLTAIIGSNFSGKTTARDALYVAAFGYHPALGKTAKATYQLASGAEMIVEAIATASRIRREYRLAGKSVKTLTTGNADEITGAWSEFPMRVLLPESFMNETAKQRLTTLATIAGGEKIDEAAALADELDKKHKLTLSKSVREDKGLDYAAAVAVEIEGKASAAQSDIKRLEASLLTFADLDSEQPPVKPANSREARDKLAAATLAEQTAKNELDALNMRAEKASEAQDKMADAITAEEIEQAAQFDALAEKLAAAEAAEESAEKAMDEAHARFTAVQKEIADIIAKYPGQSLENVAADITTIEEMPEHDSAAVKTWHDEANRKLTVGIEQERAALRASGTAQDQLNRLNGMECCPTCKASQEGWRDEVTRVFQEQLNKANQTLEELKAEQEKAVAEFEKARKALAECERCDSARRMLPQLTEAFSAFQRAARLQGELPGLESLIESTERAYSSAQMTTGDASDAKEAAAAAKARVDANAAFAAIIAAAPKGYELSAAEVLVAESIEARQKAEAACEAEQHKHDAVTRQSERWNQADAVRKQLEEAQTNKVNATRDAASLRDAMAAAVESAYGPIIGAANDIGRDILKRPIAAFDGELGTWGDAFIPWEIMSGTEQAIAIAAIQCALSVKGGGILIIDELSRVDSGNKVKMLKNITRMQKEGKVSQVMVLDHDLAFWRADGFPAVDGWNVIKV